VTALIRPKEGILDPEGEAVRGSLRQLGFSVAHVRVGRLVDLDVEAGSGPEAARQAAEMCDRLLANALIESYEIAVHEEPGGWTPDEG
jgi:phosphoribosylformylglycinamidine synthase